MSFSQKFGFETETLPLDDGLFKPLQDAKRRWYEENKVLNIFFREHFRVFYELSDGRFVTVIYRDCVPDVVRRWFRKTVIWRSDTRPRLGEVDPRTLVYFLRQWSMPIPEDLEKYLLPEPPPPLRDLSTWVGRYSLYVNQRGIHDLDILDEIESIVAIGITSVQEIREWARPNGVCPKQHTDFFAAALLRHHLVNREKWWGSREVIPPKAVHLSNAPWPAAYESLKKAFDDLVSRYEGLLTVTTFMFPMEDKTFPTREEQIAFNQELMDRLPDLEKCLGRLQVELDAVRQAAAEEANKKQPPGKRPQDEEFLIHRIWHREGGTQDQVAKRFTEVTHLPMTQGQVSKALANVKAWKAAGQAEPDPVHLHPLIYKTVDPQILDLGPRLDGQTPRQRQKREPE